MSVWLFQIYWITFPRILGGGKEVKAPPVPVQPAIDRHTAKRSPTPRLHLLSSERRYSYIKCIKQARTASNRSVAAHQWCIQMSPPRRSTRGGTSLRASAHDGLKPYVSPLSLLTHVLTYMATQRTSSQGSMMSSKPVTLKQK